MQVLRLKAHRKRKSALTLAESLLAAVLLALAVVGVSQAVVAGQMQAYAALHRRRGVELAEALLDEVLRLPYSDPDGASSPGPESGETSRASFDNLDDYHGFSQAAGSITEFSGAAHPSGYQAFSRSVTVTASFVTITGYVTALPGQTVTVTVQDAGETVCTLTRFVGQP